MVSIEGQYQYRFVVLPVLEVQVPPVVVTVSKSFISFARSRGGHSIHGTGNMFVDGQFLLD
jgi:hypothetical protein